MLNLKKILTEFRTAGTQDLSDDTFQRRISLSVNDLSICIILINLTLGIPAYFMTHSLGLLTGVLLEIVLAPIPIYLNHRRRHLGAAIVLYMILAAATFFFCCLLGHLAKVDLMIVVLIGLAMFVFTDLRIQILTLIMSILVFIAVQLNQSVRLIEPILASATIGYFLFWSAFAAVIFLVIMVFKGYGRMNDSLREKAEQDNKNKDRLIANATHEIKVSFRSVFAIISLLQKIDTRYKVEDFKDAVDDLRSACKNTSNIIDNIFEYERYNAGRKPVLRQQLVNIRGTLQSIVDIYRHAADEKNVALELLVSDSIPYHIVCDEMRLRQIVTNLLHNAIKFTNNDTSVEVDVSFFHGQLFISVRDQGDGIAWGIRDRMFEPFVTQNPDGLGLGLYIVRQLVTALNGSIEVLNNPTGGTTMRVSWALPGLEAYRSAAVVLQ